MTGAGSAGSVPGSPCQPHHSPETSRDGLLITETPGAEQVSSLLEKPVQTEAPQLKVSPNWASMFPESAAAPSHGLGTEETGQRWDEQETWERAFSKLESAVGGAVGGGVGSAHWDPTEPQCWQPQPDFFS